MNIKKCMNGHFFDVDKYQLCPHCGAGIDGGNGQAKQDSNDAKKEHKGLFGHKKKNKEQTENIVQENQAFVNNQMQNVQNVQPVRAVTLPERPATVICPSCHAQIDSDCKFCIKCGFKLEPEKMLQNNDRVKTSATTTPTVGFSQHTTQPKPVQQAVQGAQMAQPQNVQQAVQGTQQPVQPKPVQQAVQGTQQPVQPKPVQQVAQGAQGTRQTQPKPVQQTAQGIQQSVQAAQPQNLQQAQPLAQTAAQNNQNVQPQLQPSEPKPANGVQNTLSNITEVSGTETDRMDLQAAIRSAVSGSEGRTVGFFSMDIANKANETSETTENEANTVNDNSQAQNQSESRPVPVSMMSEPVVGWLVCVGGVSFGESFGLYAGRNSVGRSVNNRVIIAKDNTVSRDKHAWIIYEPKKRVFYVQPGEASGLTYLHKEILLDTKQLEPRDIIEIGSGRYMLIPLCGPDFSWEDYLR
ncbi:MAG: hypothetical protein MJ131_03040 [Lachnospiraceae bacterium]|nr:hypothetical protein [Lachnospiraceae bacterium]